MVEALVVAEPLLGRSVGSKESDFVVSEIFDAGQGDAQVRKAVPLHRHRSEDEAWYVLEGRLGFQFGDREFEAGPGTAVLLPHGVPHAFWNAGGAAARYLLIVRPKTAALLEVLHGPDRPAGTAIRACYERFDVDLLE